MGCYTYTFRLFDNISKCDVKIPDVIDDLLADLISGMLRKDPNERFNIQTIKKHE